METVDTSNNPLFLPSHPRPALTTSRKKQVSKKQTTSKILVRNIPFQANQREIRELFRWVPPWAVGTAPPGGWEAAWVLTVSVQRSGAFQTLPLISSWHRSTLASLEAGGRPGVCLHPRAVTKLEGQLF